MVGVFEGVNDTVGVKVGVTVGVSDGTTLVRVGVCGVGVTGGGVGQRKYARKARPITNKAIMKPIYFATCGGNLCKNFCHQVSGTGSGALPKAFNKRTLPYSGYSGDPDSDRFTRMGQTGSDDLLCILQMFRQITFNKGYGTAQNGDVPF